MSIQDWGLEIVNAPRMCNQSCVRCTLSYSLIYMTYACNFFIVTCELSHQVTCLAPNNLKWTQWTLALVGIVTSHLISLFDLFQVRDLLALVCPLFAFRLTISMVMVNLVWWTSNSTMHSNSVNRIWLFSLTHFRAHSFIPKCFQFWVSSGMSDLALLRPS